LELFELFSIENKWNRTTVRWTESTTPVHGIYGISLNEGVSSVTYARDLMKMKGYPASNRGCTRLNERRRLDRGGVAAALLVGAAVPWPTSLERARRWLWGTFLNEVYPYGGGARWQTHLRGSWAVAVSRAVRTTSSSKTTNNFPLVSPSSS
jgi:hypothetical protein